MVENNSSYFPLGFSIIENSQNLCGCYCSLIEKVILIYFGVLLEYCISLKPNSKIIKMVLFHSLDMPAQQLIQHNL